MLRITVYFLLASTHCRHSGWPIQARLIQLATLYLCHMFPSSLGRFGANYSTQITFPSILSSPAVCSCFYLYSRLHCRGLAGIDEAGTRGSNEQTGHSTVYIQYGCQSARTTKPKSSVLVDETQYHMTGGNTDIRIGRCPIIILTICYIHTLLEHTLF